MAGEIGPAAPHQPTGFWSADWVLLGVGEGRGVCRIEAGGEAVHLVPRPGNLRELAGQLLDLRPEVAHLLDRDAGVHERAAQVVGRVGWRGLGGRRARPLMAATTCLSSGRVSTPI